MFEQPPCPDGHGEECPERACTECGTAVLVDTAMLIGTAPAPDATSDRTRPTRKLPTRHQPAREDQPARDRSAHPRPSRAGSTRTVA
ncbi:hypothetical protein [Actinomadura terrae]|uniref:hypothetical protein n=1 Tax=Actinomadura terrae TaxID=604353 RepID=UPI001FA7D8CB|nr:hypothetical protein [Actinomadura terrae]